MNKKSVKSRSFVVQKNLFNGAEAPYRFKLCAHLLFNIFICKSR